MTTCDISLLFNTDESSFAGNFSQHALLIFCSFQNEFKFTNGRNYWICIKLLSVSIIITEMPSQCVATPSERKSNLTVVTTATQRLYGITHISTEIQEYIFLCKFQEMVGRIKATSYGNFFLQVNYTLIQWLLNPCSHPSPVLVGRGSVI